MYRSWLSSKWNGYYFYENVVVKTTFRCSLDHLMRCHLKRQGRKNKNIFNDPRYWRRDFGSFRGKKANVRCLINRWIVMEMKSHFERSLYFRPSSMKSSSHIFWSYFHTSQDDGLNMRHKDWEESETRVLFGSIFQFRKDPAPKILLHFVLSQFCSQLEYLRF